MDLKLSFFGQTPVSSRSQWLILVFNSASFTVFCVPRSFTCRSQTWIILHPQIKPVLHRRELLFLTEGTRQGLGLHSVQEEQLDPGQGAQIPRVTAHRQCRQAGRQLCRGEATMSEKLQRYPAALQHIAKNGATSVKQVFFFIGESFV